MTGPFGDVRVLEVSRGQAARMAGMLLADLGADVVRILPEAARGQAPPAPQDLAWDRGKRFAASDQLSALAQAADVLLSDASWEEGTGFAARAAGPYPGLDAAARRHRPVRGPARRPGAAQRPGRVRRQPSVAAGLPVASVVPTFTAVHAAMGAAAAAAALLRTRMAAAAAWSRTARSPTAGSPTARPRPQGDTVVVSGLHAMAACLCSMAITGLDVAEVYSTRQPHPRRAELPRLPGGRRPLALPGGAQPGALHPRAGRPGPGGRHAAARRGRRVHEHPGPPDRHAGGQRAGEDVRYPHLRASGSPTSPRPASPSPPSRPAPSGWPGRTTTAWSPSTIRPSGRSPCPPSPSGCRPPPARSVTPIPNVPAPPSHHPGQPSRRPASDEQLPPRPSPRAPARRAAGGGPEHVPGRAVRQQPARRLRGRGRQGGAAGRRPLPRVRRLLRGG